jgi:uncharacterized protein (DUF58 family)
MFGKKNKGPLFGRRDRGIKVGKDKTRRQIAQMVSQTLPELLLEADKLSNGLLGLKQSAVEGHSPNFRQFKNYQQGIDNPRKIDWAASERNLDVEGKPIMTMREREMEMPKVLYLFGDRSPSMDYRSETANYSKKDAADILLLTLAFLAVKSEEQFTLLGSSMPVSSNAAAVEILAQRLRADTEDNDAPQDLPQKASHLGHRLHENSSVFLVGDFMGDISQTITAIEALKNAQCSGFIIQVLDPQEIDFDFEGHVEFEDLESGATHRLEETNDLKKAYQAALHKHQTALRDAVFDMPGWSMITYVTDQPLTGALKPVYDQRLMANGNKRAMPHHHSTTEHTPKPS